jgi:hypothetical protein
MGCQGKKESLEGLQVGGVSTGGGGHEGGADNTSSGGGVAGSSGNGERERDREGLEQGRRVFGNFR